MEIYEIVIEIREVIEGGNSGWFDMDTILIIKVVGISLLSSQCFVYVFIWCNFRFFLLIYENPNILCKKKKILKTSEFVGFEKTSSFALFTFTISTMLLCFLLVSYFSKYCTRNDENRNCFLQTKYTL